MGWDLRSRRNVGAAAWAVGLVVALVWGALDGTGAEGVGYGFAPPVEIAALETARVLEVSVALHQAVTDDDIVVRMDPTALREEREIASADLLAVQGEAERQAMTDSRRFAEGRESSEVSRARLNARLQEDRSKLVNLKELLRLEEGLAETGASSVQAVEGWKRQIRVVEARIQANRTAVAAASSAAEGAASRSDALTTTSDWSVVAATRVLEHVEGRLERLSLRAEIDGQVSWIYRQPGEVVRAGDPIVQIRQVGTREVVAFLSPAEATGLEVGERASIRRTSGQVVRGELLSVGAGPQPLPEALWRSPGWPEHGVPIRVRLESEIGPDEPVTVRL